MAPVLVILNLERDEEFVGEKRKLVSLSPFTGLKTKLWIVPHSALMTRSAKGWC